jgi:tagatose 1,6-diphosphate aldolase GatY/KbaY
MLTSVKELLLAAQRAGYALGAFNVYNLEGVLAVIRGAESQSSPVILQVHPAALHFAGPELLSLCIASAQRARVPVGVHLDHSTSATEIKDAFGLGVESIMADGSHLEYDENVGFCREMAVLAHENDAAVEVELGRLSGTEDGLTLSERNAKLTDPVQAMEFIDKTGADSLAVCIGNVHGLYSGEPVLDMERLSEIQRLVKVPLVLHGASGLPVNTIRQAIELGVCKFNVNTEVREAYLNTLAETGAKKRDLLDVMKQATSAMQEVVCNKLQEFGSCGRSGLAARMPLRALNSI